MLSPQEELSMWKEYFDSSTSVKRKDQIRDKMITAHLKLAFRIARKYKNKRVDLDDLLSEAQIGLIKAFERYELGNGARFATYAAWWIKSDVSYYTMQNTATFKIGTTAFQKALYFHYRNLEKDVLKEDPTLTHAEIVDAIARLCIEKGVTKYKKLPKVKEQIEAFLDITRPRAALDKVIGTGRNSSAFVSFIPDTSPLHDELYMRDEEMVLRRDFLKVAKKQFLDDGKDREWDILQRRKLDEPKQTLEDLAQIYSVSRERIRQIEGRALERLEAMAKTHFAKAAQPAPVKQKPALPKRKKAPVLIAPATPKAVSMDVPDLNSPLKMSYQAFLRTGDITYSEIQALKDKYFELTRSRAGNKGRNWHIFEMVKFAQHRDKNDVIARLHGVHLTQIHAIIGAVDKTLLKPEPLSPKSIEAEFVPF